MDMIWHHPSPSRDGQQVGCFYALACLPKAARNVECLRSIPSDFTYTGYYLYTLRGQQRILRLQANGARWEMCLCETIATPELIAAIKSGKEK